MKEIQTDDKFEIVYEPIDVTYSGQNLKVIPTEPNFEPTKEQQRTLIKYSITKYQRSEIRSILTNQVEFIDPGESFDSVFCNHCGQNLEIEYWQDAMDKAYQNAFNDLSIVTSCCNKTTTLNDLKYHFPAGFSKYQLVINTPMPERTESDFTSEIEQILGKEVRLIWEHH